MMALLSRRHFLRHMKRVHCTVLKYSTRTPSVEFIRLSKVRPRTSAWYQLHVEATRRNLILQDLPVASKSVLVRMTYQMCCTTWVMILCCTGTRNMSITQVVQVHKHKFRVSSFLRTSTCTCTLEHCKLYSYFSAICRCGTSTIYRTRPWVFGRR
jgi:hypothetical protein